MGKALAALARATATATATAHPPLFCEEQLKLRLPASQQLPGTAQLLRESKNLVSLSFPAWSTTSASKKVRWCARGRWATPPRRFRSPPPLSPPPPSSKTPPSRCDLRPPSPRRTGRNASGSSEEDAKKKNEKKKRN